MVDPPNVVAALVQPRSDDVAATAAACGAKRAVARAGDPPSGNEGDGELCGHGLSATWP
jgi:hypothetical protein